MCVIFVLEDQRPTPREVAQAFEANSHGGGVAWRNEQGLVQWDKGLNLEAMQHYAEHLPFPFVMHFRIATCGGKGKSVCHPFPIDKNPSPLYTGTTKGNVLFHNGHWNGWEREIREAAIRSGRKLPLGPWSDSRAIAWYLGNWGLGMLDFIPEKICILGPDFLETYGSGWSYYDKRFVVSNTHWTSRHVSGYSGSTAGSSYHTTPPASMCPVTPPTPMPSVQQPGGAAGQKPTPFSEETLATLALGDLNDLRVRRLIGKGLYRRVKREIEARDLRKRMQEAKEHLVESGRAPIILH